MSFAAAFVGLLFLFLALGRLLFPDPDGSLDGKNRDEFHQMLKATEGGSPVALLHKLCVPLIVEFYFPFLRPGPGIAAGVALICLAAAIATL